MAQLSDDRYAFGGALLPLAEAQARITNAHAVKARVETVPLAAAIGRVLAGNAVAPIDLPPTDNSAVDGFVLYFDDLSTDAPTTLPIHGRAAAGALRGLRPDPGLSGVRRRRGLQLPLLQARPLSALCPLRSAPPVPLVVPLFFLSICAFRSLYPSSATS